MGGREHEKGTEIERQWNNRIGSKRKREEIGEGKGSEG